MGLAPCPQRSARPAPSRQSGRRAEMGAARQAVGAMHCTRGCGTHALLVLPHHQVPPPGAGGDSLRYNTPQEEETYTEAGIEVVGRTRAIRSTPEVVPLIGAALPHGELLPTSPPVRAWNGQSELAASLTSAPGQLGYIDLQVQICVYKLYQSSKRPQEI